MINKGSLYAAMSTNSTLLTQTQRTSTLIVPIDVITELKTAIEKQDAERIKDLFEQNILIPSEVQKLPGLFKLALDLWQIQLKATPENVAAHEQVLKVLINSSYFNLDVIADIYIDAGQTLRENFEEFLKKEFGSLDIAMDNSTFFISVIKKSPAVAFQLVSANKVDVNFCGFSSKAPRNIVKAVFTAETESFSQNGLQLTQLSQVMIARGAEFYENPYADLPQELRPFVNPKNFKPGYDSQALLTEITTNANAQQKLVDIQNSLTSYMVKFQPQQNNNNNNDDNSDKKKLLEKEPKPKSRGCLSWLCGGSSNSYKQLNDEDTPTADKPSGIQMQK